MSQNPVHYPILNRISPIGKDISDSLKTINYSSKIPDEFLRISNIIPNIISYCHLLHIANESIY